MEIDRKKTRRERFFELYKNVMVPKFKDYENLRIRERRKIIFAKVFFIIATLYLLLMYILRQCDINGYEKLVAIGFSFFTVSILYLIYILPKAKYFSETVKMEFLSQILEVLGDIKLGVTTTNYMDILKSNLFPNFDEITYGDSFYGFYRGVKYEIVEISLKKITKSKNRERRSCLFKGILLKFDSNKKFNGRVKILSKDDFVMRFTCSLLLFSFIMLLIIAFLYLKYTLYWEVFIAILIFDIFILNTFFYYQKSEGKMKKIILEDPEICKKFVVKATDQVEARYLLTTSFISKFAKLRTTFRGKNLKCAFFDNTIMFAIESNDDFFEIANIDKTLESPEMVIKFYNEIVAINQMIKYFNFDKKIGL